MTKWIEVFQIRVFVELQVISATKQACDLKTGSTLWVGVNGKKGFGKSRPQPPGVGSV